LLYDNFGDFVKNKAVLKLEKLKKQIETMPDNYQRSLLIKDYHVLFSYLVDNGTLNNEQIRYFRISCDYDKYNRIFNKKNSKNIHDILNNNDSLLKIDVDLYESYIQGNWNKKCKNFFVSDDLGERLLSECLKKIDNNLFMVYEKIKKDNITSLACDIKDTDGTSYGISGNNYSYINIKDSSYISKFITLIHEFGHVYQFYLLRNHGEIAYNSIIDEVMPLFLEKYFLNYLESNSEYYMVIDSLWYNYYASHFWILMDILLTSILFKNNKISGINPNLQCSTNCEVNEIIDLAYELGYIIEEIPNLSLINYTYVIGDIISDYFIRKVEFDKEHGFRELCNFIQEAQYYSLSEILEKYAGDLQYTKSRILSVIENDRSYHKKK